MRVGQVVQLWYDEEPDYDYKNPRFSNKTGHFSQVIWKATTEIGCAFVTRCGSDRPYVWVANIIHQAIMSDNLLKMYFPRNPRNSDAEAFCPDQDGNMFFINDDKGQKEL